MLTFFKKKKLAKKLTINGKLLYPLMIKLSLCLCCLRINNILEINENEDK